MSSTKNDSRELFQVEHSFCKQHADNTVKWLQLVTRYLYQSSAVFPYKCIRCTNVRHTCSTCKCACALSRRQLNFRVHSVRKGQINTATQSHTAFDLTQYNEVLKRDINTRKKMIFVPHATLRINHVHCRKWSVQFKYRLIEGSFTTLLALA